MKSNIFREVLDEEYIEVNKSVSETIEHLCEFSPTDHQDLPTDTYMHFLCSKKGKIIGRYTYLQSSLPRLYSRHKTFENYYPLYCLYGKVISKNGKTYIKMNSVYKRSNLFLRYFLKAIGVAIIPLYLLLSIPFDVFIFRFPLFLLAIAISLAVFLNSDSPLAAQKSRALIMMPIMKNELKRRVQIIEKWEDQDITG